ncbi:uncharacterized protein LOC128234655 isoform X2 [Mya arenaria]|nr:uncharacterized protein LOC128234655 isoform X2 [Mya arenaria]
MASILLDLDDIAYIDDSIENIADIENEERASARKRNTLVGDHIEVNLNQTHIHELRRDRRENQSAKNALRKEPDKHLGKLIQCPEQERSLRELRSERAKLLKKVESAAKKPGEESPRLQKKADKLSTKREENSLSEENSFSLIKRLGNQTKTTDSVPKQEENKLQMANSSDKENSDDRAERRNNKNTSKEQDEGCPKKLLEPNEDGKFHRQDNLESFKDTDKILPKMTKVNCSKVSPTEEKARFFVFPSTADYLSLGDTSETTPAQYSEDETDSKYQRLLSDSSNSEGFASEIRRYTRRPQTVGKTGSKKGKRKNPYNVKPEDIQNAIAASTCKTMEIKIVVTDEEGIDKVHAGEGTSKSTSKSSSLRLSTTTSEATTPISPSQESKSSGSFNNYLRQLSEENVGKKGNNLLLQQELYRQQNAKPFQKFSKYKSGLYQIGIEGDSKQSYVKSMTLLPDNRFVIFDKNNKCLKLFDHEFNPLDKMNINVKYCGLAAVQNCTVAASMPELKRLQLFSCHPQTNKISREKTLPFEAEIYAIAHYDTKLYMLQRVRKHHLTEADDWVVKKFHLTGESGELPTIRTFSPGHKDCSLLANKNGLYLTNRIENEVLLLGHDGTFKYRHKVEYALPTGITDDKIGNIYVCGGSWTSFIEIIKPDLRKYRVIYNKTSTSPVAMCFDKEKSYLYVADKIHMNILQYEIEHTGTVQGLMKSLLIGPSPTPTNSS